MRRAETRSDGTTSLQYLEGPKNGRRHTAIDGNHNEMQSSDGLGRIRTIHGASCTQSSFPLAAQWRCQRSTLGHVVKVRTIVGIIAGFFSWWAVFYLSL